MSLSSTQVKDPLLDTFGESTQPNGMTEVLQRLHLVPGAKEALALTRRVVSSPSTTHADLLEALRGVHQRLVIESCPDFWLHELAVEPSGLNQDQIDLAADAASARMEEAATVANIIETLEEAHSEYTRRDASAESAR